MRRDEISRILARKTGASWTNIVRELVALLDNHGIWYRDLTDSICYPWTLLLGLEPSTRVLEINCRIGGATAALARHAGHVFAIDMTHENLELAKVRLCDAGLIEKVTLIAGGDTDRLPFRTSSIDYVTVVGALKYAAVEIYAHEPEKHGGRRLLDDLLSPFGSNSPQRCQQALLLEIFRVLKPDGRLFLAAENRFYYNYFGRIPDRATEIRCISLLPRTIANVCSLLIRHKPYRSYSYSGHAYLKLLQKAGFNSKDMYVLSPRPWRVKEILNTKYASKCWSLKRYGQVKPYHRRCLLPLAAAYGFHAVKRPELDRQTSCTPMTGPISHIQRVENLTLKLLTTNTWAKCTAFASGDSGNVVVKIPLNARAREGAARSYEFLTWLARTRGIVSYVPRAIKRGTAFTYQYYIESFIDGTPLETLLTVHSYDQWLDSVGEFLNWLNPGVDRDRLVAVDSSAYWARVVTLFDLLSGKLPCPRLAEQALSALRGLLSGMRFSAGIVHGDLNSSNIMVRNGQISGVIDWDDVRRDENIVLNAISFVDWARRQLEPGVPVGEGIRRLAAWDQLSGAESRFLASRYQRCGVDAAYHRALVYLYWIQQVSDQIDGPVGCDAAVVHDLIVVVLEDLVRLAEAGSDLSV